MSYELTRSIIHKCPAIKLPQSFAEKLGMTAQIVPMHCDEETAVALVAQLNAAAPQPAGELIQVTKEDGNNYCRILSLLGMEEEGDPVARIEQLLAAPAQAAPPNAIKQEPSQSEKVCMQVYQVVGSMLDDLGQFNTDRAAKVLDNLSEMRLVHDDVLPWPSFAAQAALAPQPEPALVNQQLTTGATPPAAHAVDAMRRYLNDVCQDGTATERGVAQSVLKMLDAVLAPKEQP